MPTRVEHFKTLTNHEFFCDSASSKHSWYPLSSLKHDYWFPSEVGPATLASRGGLHSIKSLEPYINPEIRFASFLTLTPVRARIREAASMGVGRPRLNGSS